MTEIKNELAVTTATEQAQVDAIVEQMQANDTTNRNPFQEVVDTKQQEQILQEAINNFKVPNGCHVRIASLANDIKAIAHDLPQSGLITEQYLRQDINFLVGVRLAVPEGTTSLSALVDSLCVWLGSRSCDALEIQAVFVKDNDIMVSRTTIRTDGNGFEELSTNRAATDFTKPDYQVLYQASFIYGMVKELQKEVNHDE